MNQKDPVHWINWMTLVYGRKERVKGRLRFRKWLLTWWSCICIGWSKEGLPTQRVLPRLNSQLNFHMNPHRIKNRYYYESFLFICFVKHVYMFWVLFNCNLQRLVDVELGFHFFLHLGGCFKTEVPLSWLNNKIKIFRVYKNGWMLFLPLTNYILITGFCWCGEGFDRETNSNGPINLWRCWVW